MNQQREMSKRQMRRQEIRRKAMRGRLFWTGLITVAALFFGFLILYPILKPPAAITSIEPKSRPQADANHMGNPAAPIKITEYADYQCPFCERFFSQTESQLEEQYVATGKVYFTYRSAGNWVSNNMGGGQTESEDAAKAAYCAGDQNKYWEMHDMLFTNVIGEDVGSFDDRRLDVIAEATGLDMTEYKECYSSNKYQDQVDQDLKDARDAGVNGTPTFVVTYTNAAGEEITQNIEGAQPIEVFQQAIEAILAEIGQ